MTSQAASPRVNSYLEVRRLTQWAERDASGYLAGVRELRRREAVERLRGELVEHLNADRRSTADLVLRASIGLAVLGCLLAAIALVVVGLLG